MKTRHKLKSKILGLLVYFVISLLRKTLRIRIDYHPDYVKTKPYLFAFWHGKQLLPVVLLRKLHFTKGAVLVSPSRDGDLLSSVLEKFGYEIIRGSSRDRNISSLANMMKKLKQDYSLGFGVDGPIGPLYTVKPGMTHMAERAQIAIIPVGSAFKRKWIFEKAWDKFEVPKPFTKAALYLGKPIHIEKGADLEACNRKLEIAIHEAEEKALSLL